MAVLFTVLNAITTVILTAWGVIFKGCTWGKAPEDLEERRKNLKRIFVYPGYSNVGIRNQTK